MQDKKLCQLNYGKILRPMDFLFEILLHPEFDDLSYKIYR